MPNFQDLTGCRFGRLTVISRAENKNGKVVWHCKCDCGNESDVYATCLKSGNTKSCGCYQRFRASTTGVIHGETQKTRLYNIWNNIKERCYGVNCKDYPDYGSRGISVCDEWRNNYLSFKQWAIENGYNDSMSIDRIDVNGDYEPSNCRWATNIVQANNKRNSRFVEFRGETHTLSEWSRIKHINVNTLYSRLTKGWGAEMALTKQVKKMKGES